MKAMKALTLAACLMAAMAVCAKPKAATTEEWKRDVQAIANDILAIHPAPFGKIGEIIWRRKVDKLMADLPQLNEQQRVVRLMQLVALLGDGHTQIELEDEKYAQWYPLRVRAFADGNYVTSAHKSVAELAGAQIVEINGRPADHAFADVQSLMGADNQFGAMQRIYAVHNAYLMAGLGLASPDGSITMRFRLRDGRSETRTLQPRPADEGFYPDGVPIFEWQFRPELFGMPFDTPNDWITVFNDLAVSAFLERDESRPPFLQHKSIYTSRAMKESDAFYLQLNQTDDLGMVRFMSEALKEIGVLKPKRFIIDIRYNFGGDGSTVRPMIHQFIQLDADKPWDELYLITGPKTFSAALAIVDAFIDNTDVTIIGEPAGAALNSYGDAASRPYPTLGISLDVSTVIHQLGQSNDYSPYTPVDVPAQMTFADYAAGRDPAVDPILAGEEMRSIPSIIIAEGGAAARRAFVERHARFENLDWYAPPSEFSIRVAVDQILKQGRVAQAVEGAKLNSEIHPFIWNTWYNLAAAQRQTERPLDRLSSYKCVVLLASTNWNAPGIHALFDEMNVDPSPPPGCPFQE